VLPPSFFDGDGNRKQTEVARLIAWATNNGIRHVFEQLPQWARLLANHRRHVATPATAQPPVDEDPAAVATLYAAGPLEKEPLVTVVHGELGDVNATWKKAVVDGMCNGETAVAKHFDGEVERQVGQITEQERKAEVHRARELTAANEDLESDPFDESSWAPQPKFELPVGRSTGGWTVRATKNFVTLVNEKSQDLLRLADYVLCFDKKKLVVLATHREIDRSLANLAAEGARVLRWRSDELPAPVKALLALFNGEVNKIDPSVVDLAYNGELVPPLRGSDAVRRFLQRRCLVGTRFAGSELEELCQLREGSPGPPRDTLKSGSEPATESSSAFF